MKLKIVPIANEVTPHTTLMAIQRLLDQLPEVNYQVISGGEFDYDYHDRDFEPFEDGLTIGLKVKLNA